MPIARSLFFEAKKLRVFDFDDTLVKTDSYVYVKHQNGRETKLSPGQFAVHTLKSGDTYDFRDFNAVVNPTEIKAITKALRGMVSGSGNLFERKDMS